LGPTPIGTRSIAFNPTFGSFTLLELVSLAKVIRLFKLEHIFFGVQSMDTIGRCTTPYLFIGRASLFVTPCFYSKQNISSFHWVFLFVEFNGYFTSQTIFWTPIAMVSLFCIFSEGMLTWLFVGHLC
jgi:hypothetical protein